MRPETVKFRRDSDRLTADFVAKWRAVWPALDIRDLDGSFPRWLVAAAALTGRYRTAEAGLAVEYLSALSDFAAVRAAALEPARFAVAMRVSTVVAAKVATRNGLSILDAAALAFSSSAGSASRLVWDGGRSTITATTAADPSCRGWQRVGSGECDWCQMLIDRGSVYSEAAADFEAHDRCRCCAEPVYT